MTSQRGGVVIREYVTAELQKDNNDHQQFLVIFDCMEHEQLVVDKVNTVLVNVITVGGMDG